MLSTLIGQLQNYFSRYFVVGSFCPILAFALLNGVAGYFLFASWRSWVQEHVLALTLTDGAFLTTSATLGLLLAAYVMSSISTFLRRVLEGKGWGLFAKLLILSQNRLRERMRIDLDHAAMDQADLKYARSSFEELVKAREEGKLNAPKKECNADKVKQIAQKLDELERATDRYGRVDPDVLMTIIETASGELRASDAQKSNDLLQQYFRIERTLKYAETYANVRFARNNNDLNSRFGAEEVSPTSMGNVSNTIQSYAIRRYHCNFESVWSNLQRIVQRDDKMQTTLQETKTQLDFLVACFWLTLVSSIGWMATLGFMAPTRNGFLVAALGGPTLAYAWYRAATEQYRSFADVVITTIDAFRLELLRELRLPVPADVAEEQEIWKEYDKLATFGELCNFRYEPPRPA